MSMMQMLLGASAGAETIADWFATKTYSGSSSSQLIENGLDMVGKEGLIWLKKRGSGSGNHALIGSKGSTGGDWYGWLESNSTGGDQSSVSNLVTLASNGFTLNNGGTFVSDPPNTYVSWTFLKAEKFFDIVEYTGNAGGSAQTISHGLGCLPGMLIVKKYDTSGTARPWTIYHRYMFGSNSEQATMHFDYTIRTEPDYNAWGNTDPTTTTFKVDNQDETNDNGKKYVAYLFADDEDYIKCGSYTGSSSGPAVNLGWEPQFVMIKQASGTHGATFSNWFMFDNQRVNSSGNNNRLWANYTDAEVDTVDYITFTSTGFTLTAGYAGLNYPTGDTHIYMAIRKPD